MASSSSGPDHLDPDHVYDLFLEYKAEELVNYIEYFPSRDERFRDLKRRARALQKDLESGHDLDEDLHRRNANAIRHCAHILVQQSLGFPAVGTKNWIPLRDLFDQLTASGIEVPAFSSTTAAIDLEGNTVQQGESVMTLSVHAVMSADASKGYAGIVLSTNREFITAACISVPGTGLACVFADACSRAISTAHHYAEFRGEPIQATLLNLQSDQLPLLQTASFAPEVENLRNMLTQIRHDLAHVSYEANAGAVQLAEHAFEIELDGHLMHPNLPEWVYAFFD